MAHKEVNFVDLNGNIITSIVLDNKFIYNINDLLKTYEGSNEDYITLVYNNIILNSNYIFRIDSKFIIPEGSSAKTLADLKGKTFAFGSPSSTSGHLMPRFYLMKAGINPDKDFKSIAFSGAHDATVAFVASGKADAGALNASVWDKLSDAKNPNTEKVKVLYTTPPYHDYNWTVRGGLDAAVTKKISDAFLKLNANDPSQKELMDLQRASKYIPTKSSNYDEIERAAIGAGLIKWKK